MLGLLVGSLLGMLLGSHPGSPSCAAAPRGSSCSGCVSGSKARTLGALVLGYWLRGQLDAAERSSSGLLGFGAAPSAAPTAALAARPPHASTSNPNPTADASLHGSPAPAAALTALLSLVSPTRSKAAALAVLPAVAAVAAVAPTLPDAAMSAEGAGKGAAAAAEEGARAEGWRTESTERAMCRSLSEPRSPFQRPEPYSVSRRSTIAC